MTDTTKAWLEKANGDFTVASREIKVFDNPVYEIVCFHCHQATEKLMKAALVNLKIRPPFTHDLWILSQLLSTHIPEWSAEATELEDLTRLGIETRYPNWIEARDRATEEDAQLCFSLCQKYRERLLACIKWD